jgi:hypothetical protein
VWLGLLLAVAGASGGISCAPGGPEGSRSAAVLSDQELLATFEEERATYDTLAAMLLEDRHVGMLLAQGLSVQTLPSGPGRPVQSAHHGQPAPDWMPQPRWDRYRALMARAHVNAVYRRPDQIYFQRQWIPAQRGYVYAVEEMSPIYVRNSDLLSDSILAGYQGMPLYRPIAPHWYLHYSRMDGSD